MTEEEFRRKYPHSTDEQVRLYAEAVKAQEASPRPVAEPDIPMPLITVPMPQSIAPQRRIVLEELPPTMSYSASDYDPSSSRTMRDFLLEFHSDLSPEVRQSLKSADMSDEDMLAMCFDPQMFQQEARH